MACAQLTYRESMRDIEAYLTVQAGKLYHMGLRKPVRRSTLDASDRPGQEALSLCRTPSVRWTVSRSDRHGPGTPISIIWPRLRAA